MNIKRSQLVTTGYLPRINNLRDVSARDNTGNRLRNIKGKLVGAYYHKKDKRWHAQIKIKGKSTYIGTFKTELFAHLKYLQIKDKLTKEGII